MDWHWFLAIACAVLGIADIFTYVKTAPENRTKLHLVLLICGILVLIMAVVRTVQLLSGN